MATDCVPVTPSKTVQEYSLVDWGKERESSDRILGNLSASDACFASVSGNSGCNASLGLNGRISDTSGRVSSSKRKTPKKKEHNPKVLVETVSPLTPKQKTPRRCIPRTSPLAKRKRPRKENPPEVFSGNLASATKSCRQELDFNFENHARDQHGHDSCGLIDGVTNTKVMETSFAKDEHVQMVDGFQCSAISPSTRGDAVDQTSYCAVKGFTDSLNACTESSLRDSLADGTNQKRVMDYELSSNFVLKVFNFRVIQSSQRQLMNAMADPKTFNCVWSLCPMANFRKKRSCNHSRKTKFWGMHEEVKHPKPEGCISPSTSSVNYKRKQSNMSDDLSSSCLVPTVFPSKALCVVTEGTAQEYAEDCAENSVKHIPYLDAHRLIETPISVGQHPDLKPDEFQGIIDCINQMFKRLRISEVNNRLVVRDQKVSDAILPYEGKFDPSKRRKLRPKVDLDAETLRVWKLLSEDIGGVDNETKKNWDDVREMFGRRVNSFISCMRPIQGDRRFSMWKGSVVDSVIGVFLTQNVSDHLSSSAFMSLAAKFPPSVTKRSKPNNNNVVHQESVDSDEIACDQSTDWNNEKPCLCSTEQDMRQICSCAKTKTRSVDERSYKDAVQGIQDSPSCKSSTTFSQLCTIENSAVLREVLHVEENAPQLQIDNQEENKISCDQSIVDTKFGDACAGGRNKRQAKEKQKSPVNWDDLRKQYSCGKSKDSTNDYIDSADWEAVRQASVEEVAKVIVDRGMNNLLAGRIKDFLDRMIEDHGSIDLEWLRDVPPDKAKNYLLSIPGLGLKSTECVRLLTLHHRAFPVDTNVGRILVRLGWVPLHPLPEDVQIHLLNNYPLVDTIQKYIWPRLCEISNETLYECHYQMITFGKVFCTKRQPNCNACPMKEVCRHYASASISARLRLPGVQGGRNDINPPMLVLCNDDVSRVAETNFNSETIVEFPPSPEPASREMAERDIEDFGYEYEDEIPTIKLNQEEFTKNLLDFVEKTNFLNGKGTMSKELVALSLEAASISMPKLKSVGRLRTVHQVYKVPDSHPLLAGFEKREPGDPCPYLLAIWTNDECSCQESITCDVGTSCLRDEVQKQNEEFIQGTMLIPCRTANRGSFPLNGTYFQVNEVFADHESSRRPIPVPRKLIWNFQRSSLYCGTSTTSIFRGMTTVEIQSSFLTGFICVRAIDRVTRAPKPLARRFHIHKTRLVAHE